MIDRPKRTKIAVSPFGDFAKHSRAIAMPSRKAMQPSGQPQLCAAANATAGSPEAVATGPAVTVAANGDDFQLLASYGDHPHRVGLQRFDRASAEALVSAFNTAWEKVKRLAGAANANRPIYRGHFDDPLFAAQHDDTTAYGQVTALQAREDGLYFKPKYTAAGNGLLGEGGKLYFSPRWLMRQAGGAWSPFKLLSVGLVPNPNIHGAAANAAQPEAIMLEQLLQNLGFTAEQATAAANGADGAPTLDEVTAKITGLQDAANAAPDLEAAKTQLEADLAAARQKTTEAEASVTAANARATAERTAHAETVAANAVAKGVLTEADRAATVTSLTEATDFATAANAVMTAEPVLPQGGQAKDVAARKSGVQTAANAAHAFSEKVREMMDASNGRLDYDQAWANAKKQHAALFAAMKGEGNDE